MAKAKGMEGSVVVSKNKPASYIIFDVLNYVFFGLFTLICAYPFYYLIINSISANDISARGEVLWYPTGVHFKNYVAVTQLNGLLRSAWISVARTVLGTTGTCLGCSFMGFIMFLARKMQLQQQDNNIQYQLASLNSKLQNLTEYGSILSQDSITLADISSMPASLFAQGMADLTNAHYQAMNIAGAQFNQAMSSGLFGAGTDPNVQIIAQQKMYENARKQIQKQLQARLNEEEKSMQNKKARLETQDKIIQQELQAIDQQIGNGIKNQISQFGVQG